MKIPMYHHGVSEVPETGPAILMKGEEVLNAEDAAKHRESKEVHKKIMGVEDTPSEKQEHKVQLQPKKRVKQINLRRGAKNGYIAQHDGNAEEEYPIADHKSLLKHMSEHYGDEAEAEPSGAGNE